MEAQLQAIGNIVLQNYDVAVSALLGCAGNLLTWDNGRAELLLMELRLRREAADNFILSHYADQIPGRGPLVKQTLIYGLKTAIDAGVATGIGFGAVTNSEIINRAGLGLLAGFTVGEAIRDFGQTAKLAWNAITFRA